MGIFSKLFNAKKKDEEKNADTSSSDAESVSRRGGRNREPGPDSSASGSSSRLGDGIDMPPSAPPMAPVLTGDTVVAVAPRRPPSPADPLFPNPTAGRRTAFDGPAVAGSIDVASPSPKSVQSVRDTTGAPRGTETLVNPLKALNHPGTLLPKRARHRETPADVQGRSPPPPILSRSMNVNLKNETTHRSSEPTPARLSGIRPPQPGRAVATVRTEPSRATNKEEPIELSVNSIDAAFDNIMASDAAEAAGPGRDDAVDQSELQTLFDELAALHAGSVREFICELSLAPLPKAWVNLCLAAITDLHRSAERLGRARLTAAAKAFRDALREVAQRRGQEDIDGPIRSQLLETYEGLAQSLPDAFAIASYRDQREEIIIGALLGLEHSVDAMTRHRLRTAGMCSLERIYRFSPEALTAATDIELELCVSIVARFADYRRDRAANVPEAGHESQRRRVEVLLGQLHDSDQSFSRADEDENRTRKRQLRGERDAALFRLELVLVELGELRLIEQIRRMSVGRKIARLQKLMHRLGRGALAS